MPKETPTLLLIAGPNGTGKTTFAREILTHELKGMRFLNANHQTHATYDIAHFLEIE